MIQIPLVELFYFLFTDIFPFFLKGLRSSRVCPQVPKIKISNYFLKDSRD
jgi:hypothetical protein